MMVPGLEWPRSLCTSLTFTPRIKTPDPAHETWPLPLRHQAPLAQVSLAPFQKENPHGRRLEEFGQLVPHYRSECNPTVPGTEAGSG